MWQFSRFQGGCCDEDIIIIQNTALVGTTQLPLIEKGKTDSSSIEPTFLYASGMEGITFHADHWFRSGNY
jgi:hypothetical protein